MENNIANMRVHVTRLRIYPRQKRLEAVLYRLNSYTGDYACLLELMLLIEQEYKTEVLLESSSATFTPYTNSCERIREKNLRVLTEYQAVPYKWIPEFWATVKLFKQQVIRELERLEADQHRPIYSTSNRTVGYNQI